MCARARLRVCMCVEWHIEHMSEPRSPVTVSSLRTVLLLEGDRMHKLAQSQAELTHKQTRAHTHTCTHC